MESEHSVMSAAAAASAAGARFFTATSSQDLHFMHEMLYADSTLRLPGSVWQMPAARLEVLRGSGASINDSMGALMSGWLQLYVRR